MISRVPVELGREEATRLAREELSKEVYRANRPGLVRRLLGWLVDRADELLDRVVRDGGRRVRHALSS